MMSIKRLNLTTKRYIHVNKNWRSKIFGSCYVILVKLCDVGIADGLMIIET
jgi:hypothetical protein